MRTWLALLGATSLVAALSAVADEAVESRPCLNYWAVGESEGCIKPPPPEEEEEEAKAPSPTVPPVAAAKPASPTLDDKIDSFLANHGKPPREFVAFYLDPTPEHAVQWVAKYNELLNRGQEIAVAWTQAEKLYQDAVDAGISQTVLNPNPFPQVPDFGVPVPGFNTPAYTQLSTPGKAPVIPADIGGMTPALPSQPFTDPIGTDLRKPAVPATPSQISGVQPLQISYYFSSICPYCQRFEPGFGQVVRELGNKVQVTCVDVTPMMSGHTRNPDNLNGNVPCTWRPATDEELTRLGIRQTPSLIINSGDDKPLELVSGYVEPAKLKAYFQQAQNR